MNGGDFGMQPGNGLEISTLGTEERLFWHFLSVCVYERNYRGIQCLLHIGAIPVVQRVVASVLRFHHLFAGKHKLEIRVVNELRGMHHTYGPLAFSLQRKFSLLP